MIDSLFFGGFFLNLARAKRLEYDAYVYIHISLLTDLF